MLQPVGDPYPGIAGETDRWLFVHVAQLALVPFLGALVWMLLSGLESAAARIARPALVAWVAFFSAFDAVAGIATGVLSRHDNSLAGEEREGVPRFRPVKSRAPSHARDLAAVITITKA